MEYKTACAIMFALLMILADSAWYVVANLSLAEILKGPEQASICSNEAYIDGVVLRVLANATLQDLRLPASILRLHFHDCFVHGCDASVLLDGADTEKNAFPNKNSLRGFEVIDQIKSTLVQQCGNIISCADILALTARAAVTIAGGPQWKVKRGRTDSTAAFQALANTALPSPRESLDSIIAKFAAVGLTDIKDVVALSGGHTFGRAHCSSFSDRLYNFNGTDKADPSMKGTDYVGQLEIICPKGGSPDGIADLDYTTKDEFDNKYYSNLEAGHGLLSSDEILYHGDGASKQASEVAAAALVQGYARNQTAFFLDFAESMTKMSNIAPPLNSRGEIRLNCRVVNNA